MKTRLLILIGFFALTATTVPVEAITSADAHLGGDTCCASVPEHAATDCCLPVDEDHAHEEADTCPPGCDGCFLPCCTGQACVRPASLSVDVDEVAIASLALYRDEYAPADPSVIFHPPQN